MSHFSVIVHGKSIRSDTQFFLSNFQNVIIFVCDENVMDIVSSNLSVHRYEPN